MTGPLCTSGDLESDSPRIHNQRFNLFVKCSSDAFLTANNLLNLRGREPFARPP
jgi:hypothetical protein